MKNELLHKFHDYSSFHKTKGNQLTHMVGIPLIMISLLGLFSTWKVWPVGEDFGFFQLDGGLLLLSLAGIWYLRAEWKLGIPFLFFAIGCYGVGRAFSSQWLWVAFALGWIFQFIGHYIFEKKSPAFYKNAEHLLIGPFWIFAKWVSYRFISVLSFRAE